MDGVKAKDSGVGEREPHLPKFPVPARSHFSTAPSYHQCNTRPCLASTFAPLGHPVMIVRSLRSFPYFSGKAADSHCWPQSHFVANRPQPELVLFGRLFWIAT